MSVFLRQSTDLFDLPEIAFKLKLPESSGHEKSTRPIPNLAERLERAFDKIAPAWWQLGKKLGQDRGASLSHTPSCAPNTSDFGLMLAWSLIIGEQAKENFTTLVVCDDPWLFRHLAMIEGVNAGRAPRLKPTATLRALRGWAARTKFAATAAFRLALLQRQRHHAVSQAPVLLVYGNPNSGPDGRDGYFGDLMAGLVRLTRVLHVDCPIGRARHLTSGERTTSLEAWGTFLDVFALPLARWRPARRHLSGQFRWLVRRAASQEGSTAQASAIAWQLKCQTRWLQNMRPSVVAWPWENHGWEREFVRRANHLGVKTLGYQHSVVGTQMYNYSIASNPDGVASLPDYILCTGDATREQLSMWGVPEDRLGIGGAHRIPEVKNYCVDPKGPIFLALPFDGKTARQMVAAAARLAEKGFRFLVKDHPMTPFEFRDSKGLNKTEKRFYEINGLAAVVYAATTVGLEAAIAGIPTIRFRPNGFIALDILPAGIDLPITNAEDFEANLRQVEPSNLIRDQIFPPPIFEIWQKWLET